MAFQKNRENHRRSVFEQLPCVDRRTAADLEELGFHSLDELALADPETMFSDFQRLRGGGLSRDILAVFRCAVYSAAEDYPEEEKLRWWYWRD